MKPSLTISASDGVELRPLQRADLQFALQLRNNNREQFGMTDVIAPRDHATWYERYKDAPDDLMFVIWKNGTPVGTIALYSIADGSAEFGRLAIESSERRRELAALYDQLLPGISKPPMVGIPSRHLYQIEVDRRDDVMVALNGQEIYPGVHYQLNTDYPMYVYAKGSCPKAEEAASRLISLPLHLRLTTADVERVAAALNMLSS